MKCQRHPYEAGPGVCASCLRERLLDVLASQIAHQETPRRRPDPILLPTSISPHRCSADSAGPRHQFLFFSTPQVNTPAASARRSRSFLSSLFSHPRSDEPHSDQEKSKRSSSISWLTSLIRGRRRRKKTKDAFPPAVAKPMRRACRDRGMSPAAEEDWDATSESGYSTETSEMSRRAMPTPIRGHPQHQHRHGAGLPGLGMCLSPLVRAEPARRRCHVAAASEIGFSGELRLGLAYSRSGGESLGPNRSRKLADLGRFR